MKIYPVILELNLALGESGQEAADPLEADMIGDVLQEGWMLHFLQTLILFKAMG